LDEHPPGAKEPNWIRKFANDNGDVIVSGDFQILQHWPDLIAYIESGLISFFPPSGFGRLKGYGQAALIMRWWPAIIEKAKVSQRGDCWRIPWTWTPDVTKFEKLETRALRQKTSKSHGESDHLRASISSAPTASKSQFNRFLETARKLGCDEDKERFEESLGKIAAYKPPEKPKSKKAAK
jgi:hypothetical protein